MNKNIFFVKDFLRQKKYLIGIATTLHSNFKTHPTSFESKKFDVLLQKKFFIL